MKRLCPVLFALLIFQGCGKAGNSMDRAMLFRSQILQGAGCEFSAVITADYSKELYEFRIHCKSNSEGDITFEVAEPETISQITGKLTMEGGQLTFDDQALLFPMLAEGRLSPVSGPWVMLRALRSGYINGCGEKDGGLTISIDDTYEQDALQVIIQTDESVKPVSAEIYYRKNRILTILVEDFSIL